jgi:hypothetical protein
MGLLRASQELDHVVVTEAAVTALAHPEEGQLAAIPEALHGVHVEMQHLGDLGRREQLPDLVRHHRLRLVLSCGHIWKGRVRTGQVRWVRLVVG